MARIAGIDLPKNKRVEIALTYIYGIGNTSSQNILKQADVDPNTRVFNLTDDEAKKIREIITSDYKVEGSARSEVQANIRRLMEIGSYRGLRHRRGLPVRGQRTRTNARSRKGKKKTVGRKKQTVELNRKG